MKNRHLALFLPWMLAVSLTGAEPAAKPSEPATGSPEKIVPRASTYALDQFGKIGTLELNRLSVKAITQKRKEGFTVAFEKPAADAARLDWLLIR